MTEGWHIDFALTISSHQRDHQAGLEACERLLSRPGLPPEIELATRRNQTWYLSPLASTGGIFSEPPYRRSREISLPIDDGEGWSRFNPSIAADTDGNMRMIVRSSNYRIDPAGCYVFPDSEGVIKTRNYLLDLNDDLSVRRADLIDTSLIDEPPRYDLVRGYEDCRLFWHDGWKFSATVRDRNPHGICQQVLVELDGHRAVSMAALSNGDCHEKNWMPVVPAHHSPGYPERFLYSCYPTVTLTVGYAVRRMTDGPFVARSFRGGSHLVPLRRSHAGAHLALVHESVDFPQGTMPRRVYQHRFVSFFPTTEYIREVSLPFCFHGRGIEFAAGMVLQGEDLVISYGVNDESAWLLRVPLEEALGMLKEPL